MILQKIAQFQNPNTEEPPVGGSSSTSSPFWVRASSTPATLDTSGGSSSFSSGDSFVIPMAEGQNQSDTDTSSQQVLIGFEFF